MSDFIEGTYLNEQVDAIKEISDCITNIKRCGPNGHGIFHFDEELGEWNISLQLAIANAITFTIIII